MGQDALVSLVGTIGAGLTWAGSIFVNPWMARIQDVRIITLLGVILTSLGILLASFNTKVSILFTFASQQTFIYTLLVRGVLRFLVVATVPDTGDPLWHRVVYVLFPDHVPDSRLFRRTPRICNGTHTFG